MSREVAVASDLELLLKIAPNVTPISVPWLIVISLFAQIGICSSCSTLDVPVATMQCHCFRFLTYAGTIEGRRSTRSSTVPFLSEGSCLKRSARKPHSMLMQ